MNSKSGKFYYWAFLFPALLAIVTVILIPLLYGIYTSFTNSDGFNMDFVGLENYKRLFSDQQFIESLWFTIRFAVLAVLGVNVIGLGFAVLVTQKIGSVTTVFRTMYFTPNLIGGLILGFIWQFIFIRAFAGIAESTNIEFFNGWLSDPSTAYWAMLIVFLWQMSGYIMLVYIAFLSKIPHDLIEAAQLDGASAFQTFIHIKLPMLAPAFTISLFLTLANAFKVYDLNLALTSGGPFRSSEMVAMNIYNTAFLQYQQGYAQAKGLVFLVIIILISITQVYFTRKKEVDL
ncbi:sugar ABC transporter permease [Carnobacteriaceae bacterium 52-44]